MNRISLILALVSIALLAKSQNNCVESINDDELYGSILFFSDPELNGRMSGSKGYEMAAQWVAKSFSENGLKNLGYNNYFQNFNLEYNEIKSCNLRYSNGEETVVYKLGEDYVCRGFTGSGDVSAEIVFCGYGLETESYNDYADVDVKNKVVAIFKQNPSWKIAKEDWGELSLRKKVETAAKHGAIGVIYLSKPNSKNPQKPIGSIMHGKGTQNENIPQMHISVELAKEWFAESNLGFKELQTKIDQNKQPQSKKLKGLLTIKVDAEYTLNQPSMNIVGMLEGSDPKLKKQYVVIGAHLDHVGRQGKDLYFPGANDNASGVASIMAIAKAFAECDDKPKRSIIFVAFAAEESGLEGSRHFVDNCPVKTKSIVAMLNMDCVAHGDSIVIGCGKSYPELYKIAQKEDKSLDNLMASRTWKGGGADAEAFHKVGIPTLYFVTKNTYKHLHLPTDKPETINTKLHEQITKLAFEVANEVASGNYKKERAKK